MRSRRNQLIFVASLFLLTTLTGCSDDPTEVSVTELCERPGDFDGQEVRLDEAPEQVSRQCTEAVCTDDMPCCNTCQVTLGYRCGGYFLALHEGDSDEALGCTADNCSVCDDIDADAYQRPTGIFRDATDASLVDHRLELR